MSEWAVEWKTTLDRHLRARSLPPLTEFEVVECHECYLLLRGEMAETSRQEREEATLMWRDLKGGRLPDERRIWGHPTVRQVLAGGYGPQVEMLIKQFFERRNAGKGANALD